MKRYILLFLCYSQLIVAQNLVNNPGFETFSALPTGYGQYARAVGWNNCGGSGSSDYFHTSGSLGTYFGQMTPHTGDAQMGFLTRHSSAGVAMEYVCQPMNGIMLVGQSYEVSFWVTQGNGSGGYASATGNIGALFTIGSATQSGAAPIAATPQVEETTIINVTNAWQQLTFTFTPILPFDNVAIGNFRTFAATPFANADGRAYYFVDDIIGQPVTLLSTGNLLRFDVEKHQQAQSQLTWDFEHPEDVVRVDLQRSANGFEFENIAENQTSDLTNWVDKLPYQGTNYYRLRFETTDGAVYYSDIKTLTFDDAGGAQITRVSPNPFNEWLVVDFQNTSEEEERVEIRLVDLLGRQVHSESHPIGLGRYKIELSLPSNLAAGAYFVQVITKNGSRQLHKVIRK